MKVIVSPEKEPPVSEDGRELGHGFHSETFLVGWFFFFFLIQRKFYLKAEKLNKMTLGPNEAPLPVTGMPSSSHGLPISLHYFHRTEGSPGAPCGSLDMEDPSHRGPAKGSLPCPPLSTPGLGRTSRKEKGRSAYLFQPPELSNVGPASPWPSVQRGRNA